MKVTGFVIFGFALLSFSCSRSNNLLLGEVETTVGEHKIQVTDCYRMSVPTPQQLQDLPDGKHVYAFTPCKDADVLIRGDELIVNGRTYGVIKERDAITVDHGRVLINEHETAATPMK
jgi:hypothetical protein